MTVYTGMTSSASSKDNLKLVLEKPLIAGASVSGDYLTTSPGKRLALRYTSADQIKVIAAKGRPGREVLKQVSASTLKDRTSIIGLDLFFWDSFGNSPTESLRAIDKLIGDAEKQNIPIVIGEIPALVPHMQHNLLPLNEKLQKACGAYKSCKLIPLNDLLAKVLAEGHITHEGRKYTLNQLAPDGLHIATPASEFLANEIEKLLI